MTREIVFDTETTGFDAHKGDRLVEIGAVELVNHVPTGKVYHQYINPQREVPDDAFRVHGLSYDFLKAYPTFDKIANEWLEFIEDSRLIAHNASFDINFLNYELVSINRDKLSWERVTDTLEIARGMFPGARVNLDALCKRFGIDNSDRTKHGALLDADLLAKVYLEMMGGQEPTMELSTQKSSNTKAFMNGTLERQYRAPRNFAISKNESDAHRDFLEKKIKGALWIADVSKPAE